MRVRLALLVLGSMWAFAGCGGGGGSSGSGSSSSGSGASVSISGAVVEGPVKNATIRVKKGTGVYIDGATATTREDGSYTVSVPSGETLPWKIEVSGGTDTVTNEALTMPLTTLVTSTTQTTANASTLSTLVTSAVESSAGSLANVTAASVTGMAQQVVKNYGFGVDGENSAIDIISTPITSANVSSFAMASEALGEMVRRTANAVTGTGGVAVSAERMLQALGEDMSDGKVDGNRRVAGVTSSVTTSDLPDLNKVLATVQTQAAQVALEVVTNNLSVTKNDGTSISADEVKTNLKSNLAALATRLEGVSATAEQISTKMAAVPVSENMIQQGKAAMDTMLVLNPGSSTFTQLQTSFNNMTAGTTVANVAKDLGISGASTATGSVLDLAKNEVRTMAASVTGGSISTTNFTALLNRAPRAKDNTLFLTMSPGQSVSAILPGDDMDGDALTYTLVKAPVKGTVAITNAATGAFTYTATDKNGGEWRGADKFSFLIFDGKLTSTGAWVTIMIRDPAVSDQPPTVPSEALQFTATSGMTLTGMVTGFDPEGKLLSFAVSQQPTQGTLTINSGAAKLMTKADGTFTGATSTTFTYLSNAGSSLTDTFRYVVSDGTTTSTSAAVVNLAVRVINRKPFRLTTATTAFTTPYNTPLSNQPLGIVDMDANTTLSYAMLTPTGLGSVTLSGGNFSFTPTSGMSGADKFFFQASDGTLLSDPYRVDITIGSLNLNTGSGWTNTGSGWTYTGGTYSGSAWTLSGGAWTYVSGAVDTSGSWTYSGGAWRYISDPLSQKIWAYVNGGWTTTNGFLSINNVSVTETDVGSVSATFTLSLTPASGVAVTVYAATTGISAQSGSDFLPASRTITFNAGEVSKSFAVTVLGDLMDEANETFQVNLSNANGGAVSRTTGVGTIIDNDPEPTVQFITSTQNRYEGERFSIPLTLTGGGSAMTVQIPFTVTGTATLETDYTLTPSSGMLTFTGSSTPTIGIFAKLDGLTETGGVSPTGETLILTLGNPTYASKGTLDTHTINLVDIPLEVRIPRTGQTTVYAAGDDASWTPTVGVAWANPRFTDNGNGTVTDNNTGLIWLKNANCNNGGMDWTSAVGYANALANGSCGLTDGSTAGQWRLPNRFEVKSLIDYGRILPALSSGHPFSGVQSNNYWSSSTAYMTGSSYAWLVTLRDGGVAPNDKSLTNYVWPVRGGQ